MPGPGLCVAPSTPCQASCCPAASNSTAFTTVLPASSPRKKGPASRTVVDVPRFFAACAVMDNSHQRLHHRLRIGMLIDVPPVDHPLCPLLHQRRGAF